MVIQVRDSLSSVQGCTDTFTESQGPRGRTARTAEAQYLGCAATRSWMKRNAKGWTGSQGYVCQWPVPLRVRTASVIAGARRCSDRHVFLPIFELSISIGAGVGCHIMEEVDVSPSKHLPPCLNWSSCTWIIASEDRRSWRMRKRGRVAVRGWGCLRHCNGSTRSGLGAYRARRGSHVADDG